MKGIKRIVTPIIVLTVALLASYSASFATSYFSHNPALNDLFQKMEREFLQYERKELVPLADYGEIITEENKDRIQRIERVSKPISDSQVKKAVEDKLNEMRVTIEIIEEELGGLSQEEYKIIIDHFTQKMGLLDGSYFSWDLEGENVWLYLDVYELYDFQGLVGNFARMGREKDQVNQADLKVKDKIIRYLNQSMQKGNPVSQEILAKLPSEVEKLFIESNLSKIEAYRTLAEIHEEIYNPDLRNSYANQYDGTQSVEELIESYEAKIYWVQYYREEEKKLEYFQFSQDQPSSFARESIVKNIVRGYLSETFTYGFNQAITLEELAELQFGYQTLNDKIVIESNLVSADSPDYIKSAFIYGLIDDEKDLEKPLTRLEATRHLVKGAIYGYTGLHNTLRVIDASAIPLADQINVGTCIQGGMRTIDGKFEPQKAYTKEEAILDGHTFNNIFSFDGLRGYNIPIRPWETEKIIVGKNTIHVLFEETDEIEAYIEALFYDTAFSDIKVNKSYTRIDTGGLLVELYTPEKGVKFTVKDGVTYLDFKEGVYGPGLSYQLEPRVLNNYEAVDMNMQLDSTFKKLYAKLDAILAKMITPDMTDEQKLKAIHDFVVNHITYDSNYRDAETVGSIFTTIDEGRGVCGDYTLLFMHLSRRAGIPATYEAGDPFTLQHAWNAVYINGQWLFVDTTWDDDDSGTIKYTYFLKDRFTFMKDHTPYMGVPDEDRYGEVDHMNIQNQDELRVYLLRNFYWVNGYQLTFRMADQNMKPAIPYLWSSGGINIELTYDANSNLYTVAAKAK